jgi:hypothetical protein
MQAENAPPGFWTGPSDRPLLVEGVELSSNVPTRFFQSVDAYPREWGRLRWRIQLNAIVDDRITSPMFRTFYPGVEWNLRAAADWFLTAWFTWDGPGPDAREQSALGPPIIHDDGVLFRFASTPQPLFLRLRVDARDRRRIAEEVRAREQRERTSDSRVIVLDDIIGHPQ